MDLSITESQIKLMSTATEFLNSELPKERVLEIDDSPTGFDPAFWRRICDLGWTGMVIPEEYDGKGLPFTDLAVVYQVLGSYACSIPHLDSALLSAHAILEAGDDSQKKALLPAIATGQQIISFAFTEAEHAWGPSAIQLPASLRNGNYVLNGTKFFIPWAHVADQVLVVARTSEGPSPEQGISLFLVDKNARGISTNLQSGWNGDKVCEVKFDSVEVPPSGVLGPIGEAWPAIERAMDKATAVLCAYMAGGALKVHQITQEYSQTRIALDAPTGTLQRVQTGVIDALTEAHMGCWTTYEALWRLDNGDPGAQSAISMAKAVASVGFSKACDASHNVYAGIGVEPDVGLAQYTKRARTYQPYLGDAGYHTQRMAQLMRR